MRGQVLIIAGMVIGAVVAFLLLGPKWEAIQRAERDAKRKQNERVQLAAQMGRQAEIERQHAAARGAIEQLLAQIPREPQVDGLIVQLEQALQASGMRLLQFSYAPEPPPGRPVGPTPAGAGALFVQAQVGGSYPQLRAFVDAVEGLPRIVVIDRLSITGTGDGIVADVSMRSFYWR
jgi:type IV pilus assembly protein PilO